VGIALSAYEAELQNIEDDIRALGPDALGPPIDLQNATKYAYRLYQHASLNGDLTGFREAEHTIDTVAAQVQRPDDLLLLKANLCLKLHRNDCVRQILESRPELQDTDEGMKLRGDLLFYDGQYAEARVMYERAIEKNRSWDNLARYAHYLAKFEGADRADEVYAEAEDEVTSKQMRSFAWLELQRGVLDLERGRFEEASVHYATAERAYPG
jgi:tetratricopeptide (TPR) repeat protein